MRKLAVIIGHNSLSQGAVAVAPLSLSEYDFNSGVARYMDRLSGEYNVEVGIFIRDRALDYNDQIEKAYSAADDWGADLSVELHFNGNKNKSARGTATLSSGSSKSLRFAALAQEAMVELFDRHGKSDRGVKTKTRADRGGFSLVAGNAPAILVEPFFGSSKADCELMIEKKSSLYAVALLSAASKMFGTFPRENRAGSRNLQSHTLMGSAGSVALIAGVAETLAPSLPVVSEILPLLSENWKIVAIAAGAFGLFMAVRGFRAYLQDRDREQSQ